MMPVQTENRYYTPEEYLKQEETAVDRSEYRDGEIILMAGGTTNHNQIAGNFYKKFPLTINGQDYNVYIEGVRLWIPRYRLYTYPDVMVIEGKSIYEGAGTSNVTNPLLIVEVLSKSTRDYDRTDKFKFYRSIPEFQEYILIDQYCCYVEQFYKHSDREWTFKSYEEENQNLTLYSVDFQISLQELYQRVDFNLSEE